MTEEEKERAVALRNLPKLPDRSGFPTKVQSDTFTNLLKSNKITEALNYLSPTIEAYNNELLEAAFIRNNVEKDHPISLQTFVTFLEKLSQLKTTIPFDTMAVVERSTFYDRLGVIKGEINNNNIHYLPRS